MGNKGKKNSSSSGRRKGASPMSFIKAPVRNVKGIGRMGTFEGGHKPTTIDPNRGGNGSVLTAQLLGPQGRS